jgi:hypothetical protein
MIVLASWTPPFTTNRNKAMRAVLNLQSRGISEHRILYLNDLLQKNGYNIDMKSTVELG